MDVPVIDLTLKQKLFVNLLKDSKIWKIQSKESINANKTKFTYTYLKWNTKNPNTINQFHLEYN